jgi:hypothetical protein
MTLRAVSIVAAVAISIVGCDPIEPRTEEAPKHEEHAGSKLGPPSPAPPVNPSSTPTIPADAKREMLPEEKDERAKLEAEKDRAVPKEKKVEAVPDTKQTDPKTEPPK